MEKNNKLRTDETTINPLDVAYCLGHIAHWNGYKLRTNPYNRKTELYVEWRTGWKDEQMDDGYWKKCSK